MADVAGAAAQLLEQVQATYKTQGFKIFVEQVDNEIKRQELMIQMSPARGGTSTAAIATELAWRQGGLAGMVKIRHLISEIEEELAKGRIPWLEDTPKEE